MSCSELLRRFIEELEKDEVDWDLLRKLMNKCCMFFAREAGRVFAKKVVYYYMSFAWRYYKGAAIAGKPPEVAYGEAVLMIWRLWDWYGIHCGPLADIATYIAEAAAKYQWPSKWPFVASPAVAAEVKKCELPDAVAEALGPDEFARLEAFLDQREGIVEVAGQKIALVRDGRYISIVVAV
jgi:hypothetical protein